MRLYEEEILWKLQRAEERAKERFKYRHGRDPADGELRAWLDGDWSPKTAGTASNAMRQLPPIDEAAAAAREQERLKRARALQLENEERQKRQQFLAKREVNQYKEPVESATITSIEQLKIAAENDETYAVGATIKGTRDAPILIDSNLELFNFSNAVFENVVFAKDVHLRSADFSLAKLTNVRFDRGCRLGVSSFKGATLDAVDFPVDAQLGECSFEGATLKNLTFSRGVNLGRANFSGATLQQCKFLEGCNLGYADFDRATLVSTDVSDEADITDAKFRFTTFRQGTFIQFDRNHLANAVFEGGRKDAWHKVASRFSGIWQIINVALAGLYFGIIIVKLYIFRAVHDFLAALPESQSNAETVEHRSSGVTAVDVIFGDSFLAVLTVVSLLIYQALRFLITTRVGPLIDAERMTGYTPERSVYMPLLHLSNLQTVLGVFVLCLVTYEMGSIFFLEVRVPSMLHRTFE